MRFPNPYILRSSNLYAIDFTTIFSVVTVDAYTVCNAASPTGT